MSVIYKMYLREYENAITSLKDRKGQNQTKAALNEKLKEKLTTLRELTNRITKIKEKQTQTQQLEQTLIKRRKIYEKRKNDIEAYRKVCTDKQEKIAHHTKYITAFKKEISNELKDWEKKW